VLSDYIRRGLDWQLDLLDLNTAALNYSVHTLQFTTVHFTVFTRPRPLSTDCESLEYFTAFSQLTLQPLLLLQPGPSIHPLARTH
jgi:hypothetical protein